MKIDKHTHIELTPNDLKDIVLKYLCENGYDVLEKDIEFRVTEGSMYDCAKLRGAFIVAKERKNER